jgi:hypothetical protein
MLCYFILILSVYDFSRIAYMVQYMNKLLTKIIHVVHNLKAQFNQLVGTAYM